MPEEIVKVDMKNCEFVAKRLVTRLTGAVFGISSFCHESARSPEFPKLLPDHLLKGGYRFVDGYLKIELKRRDGDPTKRAITWDLRDEQVEVCFNSGDSGFTIKRILPNGKIIFRTVMVFFC